ncbi:MAG TPA: sensor histidine kinase [Symbiobacteriaceae bacterium]|nr:sensor histidine kinase [Symbiobacteriaceae bacterium]
MNLRTYMRASGGLWIHGLMALLVTAYLLLLGAGWPSLITLWLVWLAAVGGYYGWRLLSLRSYYRGLAGTLGGLERKYLVGSVGTAPTLPELDPLWEALVEVSRSVADEVARVEKEATDHREYVEGWVHEVKAPIAAARLLAEGGARELIAELDRIEHLVEQALFYARASSVELDCFIRETSLAEPVKAVLRRHARQFIGNRVAVSLEGLELTVFTDRKWLEFILTQVLINAVKYRREGGAAEVCIRAAVEADGVSLTVEDNGIGIPRADLDRVFEKGFTGANGRRYERSTGIGLFLARKLCGALGHGIRVESEEGRFTRVTLFFPKGRLLRLS